jgi:hypothetical protein
LDNTLIKNQVFLIYKEIQNGIQNGVGFYARKNQNQRCFQAGGLAANKVDPPLSEPFFESPPPFLPMTDNVYWPPDLGKVKMKISFVKV